MQRFFSAHCLHVFETNGQMSTATLFVICFADKSFGLAARPFASLDRVVLCHVGPVLVFGFVAGRVVKVRGRRAGCRWSPSLVSSRAAFSPLHSAHLSLCKMSPPQLKKPELPSR